MLHEEITNKIIEAFYKVNNKLGYGFLEKVYENALRNELTKMGFKIDQQKNIKVYYDGDEVGDYFADLVIDDVVIVEIKSLESLCIENDAQLLNYLRATGIEVGLLLNFGKKADFRRKIFTNDRKMLKQYNLDKTVCSAFNRNVICGRRHRLTTDNGCLFVSYGYF